MLPLTRLMSACRSRLPSSAAAAVARGPAGGGMGRAHVSRPLGGHATREAVMAGATEHEKELANKIVGLALPLAPEQLLASKDPDAVANWVLKEAARKLEHEETMRSRDHTVQRGGLAAEVQSHAAHRQDVYSDDVAALVHQKVAAALGGSHQESLAESIVKAAQERMERQPPEKRPHDVVGVLREGASELEHQEAVAQGVVHKGSIASEAQSVADRAAAGRHPAVAEMVRERLEEEGVIKPQAE